MGVGFIGVYEQHHFIDHVFGKQIPEMFGPDQLNFEILMSSINRKPVFIYVAQCSKIKTVTKKGEDIKVSVKVLTWNSPRAEPPQQALMIPQRQLNQLSGQSS